jgi:hypothetical protein
MENLERRQLMAADILSAATQTSPVSSSNVAAEVQLPSPISFNAATGEMHVEGSAGTDKVQVSYQPSAGPLQVVGGMTSVKLFQPKYNSILNMWVDSLVASKTVPTLQLKKVSADLHGGNDSFINSMSIPSEVHGGDGNDYLAGGSAADFLIGGYGQDSIYGNGGHDTLWGSGGSDYMNGGAGNDELHGHGGSDTMFGGDGNDSLYGGSGNDSINGGSGNDLIVSIGGGTDTLTGGPQWDNIWKDTVDILTDASANEHQLGYIHSVDEFFSYSYSGGLTTTPVSKELAGQDLADPLPYFSHTGLSIKNFADNPLFASGGPSKNDVYQGSVGDCYFMARLSAIADAQPEYIRKMVVDLGDGTFAVRFYNGGQPEYVRVDADLWVDSSGNPKYADLGQQGAIWVPIVEKAYAFWRRQQGNYPSINGGNGGPQHVSEDLGLTQEVYEITDGVTPQQVINWVNSGSPDGWFKLNIKLRVTALLNWIQSEIASGEAVVTGAVAGVGNSTAMKVDNPNTEAQESSWRRGQHIYHVDSVLTDANGDPSGIVLRDPYGQTRTITDFTRIYFLIGRAISLDV